MIFDDNQFKALHGKELNMKNRFNHKDHIDPKEKWFLLGLCALCGKNVSVFAGGQSGRGAADIFFDNQMPAIRRFASILARRHLANWLAS